MRLTGLLLVFTLAAHGQWKIQDSHTTASLRGIDSIGNGVAWASGTEGTVLWTDNGGSTWQRCNVPPGAEALDFRGVQAFDAKTAIVMSSGKGDLSRLYKTTNGCRAWKLLLTNQDRGGFWDAMKFANKLHGFLLGDPVAVVGAKEKRVTLKQTIDGGKTWTSWERKIADFALGDDVSAFAASNSSLILLDQFHAVVAVGGEGGSAVGFPGNNEFPPKGFCVPCAIVFDKKATKDLNVWWVLDGPFPKTDSGGIFSIAFHENQVVAVGGDYKKPDSTYETAGYTAGGPGDIWHGAQTPPHGYRSAVAYDAPTKTWITVGPNGTDISTDDGRNWSALKPDPGEPADADQHWNALSLPFVVGPKGRIGVLRSDALAKAASK